MKTKIRFKKKPLSIISSIRAAYIIYNELLPLFIFYKGDINKIPDNNFISPDEIKIDSIYNFSYSHRSGSSNDDLADKKNVLYIVEFRLGNGKVESKGTKTLSEAKAILKKVQKHKRIGIRKVRDNNDDASNLSGVITLLELNPDSAFRSIAREQADNKIKSILNTPSLKLTKKYTTPKNSWFATTALMEVMESKLERTVGLYQWNAENVEFIPKDSKIETTDLPILILIHGMAGNTFDTFYDLYNNLSPEELESISNTYGQNIYGFEHNTFSKSPIENALSLAQLLPSQAKVSFITHSSGGLIGDLLCINRLDNKIINNYTHKIFSTTGSAPDTSPENTSIYRDWVIQDQNNLRELNTLLTSKNFQIQRYARVASLSSSVKMISQDFDSFLSTLLDLKTTQSIKLKGYDESETLSAFKRIVLEIIDNQIPPDMIPGIEPMLSYSAMGELIAKSPRKKAIKMLVIGGQNTNENKLAHMAESDLVTDTSSVCSGLAQNGKTYTHIHESKEISHFTYFIENSIRSSIVTWLCEDKPESIKAFSLLGQNTFVVNKDRNNVKSTLPVVFIIPDFMGSHLSVHNPSSNSMNRVWLDFNEIADGSLNKLQYSTNEVVTDDLIDDYYGNLKTFLEKSHRVISFPYDWRRALSHSANELSKEIDKIAKEIDTNPIRILAHGLGGLVVRTMIAKHPSTWNTVLAHKGSLLMLGTPNKGSHSMVESLLCKSESIRKLSMLHPSSSTQEIVNLISSFDGALQLLPRPDYFEKTAETYIQDNILNKQDNQTFNKDDYLNNWFDSNTWTQFKSLNTDHWFGNNNVGTPNNKDLTDVKKSWIELASKEKVFFQSIDKNKISYIHGQANWTSCGVIENKNKLLFLKTSEGDGLVTWESGKLEGLPENRYWYMPVDHANLTSTETYFIAIKELLEKGTTEHLKQTPPTSRSLRRVKSNDIDPTSFPGKTDIFYSMMESQQRLTINTKALQSLKISVRAMDLRDAQHPLLGGHYKADPLAGAEASIDKYLVDGALALRERIGNYASEIGDSTIVIRNQNQQELEQGTGKGTIIVGLGEWGEINVPSITETVYKGVLRYLLEYKERILLNEEKKSLKLQSLLIGQNSTNHISLESSIDAIVKGVCKANQKFASVMRQHESLYIGDLEFIEYYQDTAITAAHAISKIEERISHEVQSMHTHLKPQPKLEVKGAPRYRLSVEPSLNYWPRLLVTSADKKDNCSPSCYKQLTQSGHLLKPDETSEATNAITETSFGISENLKFVMLSERARAEATLLQRQPKLIESLISKVIMKKDANPDLSRTLFQLMVPLEFKTSIRLGDNLLLVLDDYTANLPWEMIQADNEPLIVKTAMVRQFISMGYRHVINNSECKFACLIGNPSTAGFYDHFIAEGIPEKDGGLTSLDGARKEVDSIYKELTKNQYEVVRLYPLQKNAGTGSSSVEVFNAIYKYNYRIVVIAAHGVVNAQRKNGKKQTGVVLSDGVMLTAAEISQMESVPELVFLNCCHLGKVNNTALKTTGNYNHLAYSLALELIDMGVRCVIVAGWAVDDIAASEFSKTFFREFVGKQNTFGSSIWKARKVIYENHPNTNTWGAYQAYGDPAYILDPTKEDRIDYKEEKFVSPDELLKILNHIFEDIRHKKQVSFDDLEAKVEKLLNYAPEWNARADIKFAIGRIFSEVGPQGYEKAIEAYKFVVLQKDTLGMIPIKAIEQLANLETLVGKKKGGDEGLIYIERAIERLTALIKITKSSDDDNESAIITNSERYALLGSAYKRKAKVQIDMDEPSSSVLQSLISSRDAYCDGEKTNQPLADNIYSTLNRLQYDALLLITGNGEGIDEDSNIELVKQCLHAAENKYKESYEFFDSIMITDAKLTKLLMERCENSLVKKEEKEITTAYEEITTAYKDTMETVHGSGREISSVIDQISLLAGFLNTFKNEKYKKNKKISEALKNISKTLENDFL